MRADRAAISYLPIVITMSGTSPNFTISSTATLNFSGVNTLSISGGNSVVLPTVAISPSTNVSLSGTYPNYTIASTPTLNVSGQALDISGGNTVLRIGATEA